MSKIPIIAPMTPNRRTSSDSVWPLRGADGLTFVERKEREAESVKRTDRTAP